MPRLTALKVKTSRPGIYSDGGGLYLCVSSTLARTWVYRFSWRGARPEMGLGSVESGVGLAEARADRDKYRQILRSGRNPIEVRKEKRRALAKKPTFGEIADEFLKTKAHEWRNAKHCGQWRSGLMEGTATLRSRPVDEIDTEAVLAVLKPIWIEKPETASRLRGRVEAVLDAAKAQGHRSGENPAAWRGHRSLPKRPKLKRGQHAAMAYRDIPALMEKLRSELGIAAERLRSAFSPRRARARFSARNGQR